jgi:hypothetical protein
MSVNPADASDNRIAASGTAGPVVPGAGVAFMAFGDSFGLFHEGRQELVALNETASRIWQDLALGWAPFVVAQTLVAQGAPPAAGLGYVEDALQRWLGAGWMVPADLAGPASEPPLARLNLSVLDVGFDVAFFGAVPPPGVLDMLAPLRGDGAAQHELKVAAWQGHWVLFAGSTSRGVYGPDQLAPAIKAALTDQLVVSVGEGFIAHGGLVEAASSRIFLSGAPGKGKSTLTLALGAAGFECLSDDIVHVDQRGWMRGAMFAPALKSGSWPLLAQILPALETLPVHHRADGQDVRYATDVISAGPGRPLDIFIALDRRADGPAELQPMSRLDAMSLLLKDAFASAGRVSAADMQALAHTFAAVRAYTLRYADLFGAVEQLRTLVHG